MTKKIFISLFLVMTLTFGIKSINANEYNDRWLHLTPEIVNYAFTVLPPNSKNYTYGTGRVNYMLNTFIPNELWKSYGEYYMCQPTYAAESVYCYMFSDYSQLHWDNTYVDIIALDPPYYRLDMIRTATAKYIEDKTQTFNQIYNIYTGFSDHMAYRSNLLNYLITGNIESTITYDHEETFSKNDISSFYFNAVNPASSGLFQFKIEFESNNGIFPEYNFKYLTMGLGDTTYNEADDSISGFGFDYDGCETNDNTMTCSGQIDLSLISTKNPNTIYHRWEQDIFNFDELDGTFTVYYTELANFGFATLESPLKGLTKYMLRGKDILVSPNGEYTLYIHSDYFRYLKLYDYDITLQSYNKQILATSLNDDFYYIVPISLIDDHYLRILSNLDSFVIYSDQSGLVFSTVDSDGNTSVAVPGEENKDVNIGTPIVEIDSTNESFLNDMKNAFSYFKNVFQFIFQVISEFYYSFPVGFRYFVVLSFLITIIFVVIKLM